MGIRFNLDQASLVGWLTRRDFPPPMRELDWERPSLRDWRFHHRRILDFDECEEDEGRKWRAPRIKIGVLQSFLKNLPKSVITSRPEDHELLRNFVDMSRKKIRFTGIRDEEAVVPSSDVARILAPLRLWFDVPFYFMPLGRTVPFERFRDSTDYTMWLQFKDDRLLSASQDLLDPFPPLRQLFTSKSYTPSTVCWTWSGETVVIPHETAPIEMLLDKIHKIPAKLLWSELKSLHKPEALTFNILQLSDLHFGSKAVTNRKIEYIEQHLRDRIDKLHKTGSVVQPVITGDLMDSQSKNNLKEFEAFRNRLTDHSKTNVVCIPGNHDVRKKGFLWKNWKALAGLEWECVVSSDVCKVIFVCFDTSRDAKFAQGLIANDQFLEVATKLTELHRRDIYADYIHVALVHHHPFSTREDEIDTLPFLGIREERFLRMENGDHLVRWCGSNGVPLILHGHKHLPRFIGQEIDIEGRTRLVRAVGCGSSSGIDGKPLSFNWITWQPATKQWAVSFFADPGDGSGFREKRLVIGSQQDAM